MLAHRRERRSGRLVTLASGAGGVLACLAAAVHGWTRLPLSWQGWGLLAVVGCLVLGAAGTAWDISVAERARRERERQPLQARAPAGPLRQAAVLVAMAVLATAEQDAGWLPVGALAAGGGTVLVVHLVRRAGADLPVTADDDEDDLSGLPGYGVTAAGARRTRTRRP